jgi:hypothetical protein
MKYTTCLQLSDDVNQATYSKHSKIYITISYQEVTSPELYEGVRFTAVRLIARAFLVFIAWRLRMLKMTTAAIIENTPAAIPIPMPALAPVDKLPPLLPDSPFPLIALGAVPIRGLNSSDVTLKQGM